MKQNISEILQRQLLLMGYRLDSTLSENIKNLPIIKEQTAPGTKLDTSYGLSPEEEEKRKKENEAQTYPNYCPFKEYTVLPGEVEIRGEKGTSKVVGVDPIPKGISGETYMDDVGFVQFKYALDQAFGNMVGQMMQCQNFFPIFTLH